MIEQEFNKKMINSFFFFSDCCPYANRHSSQYGRFVLSIWNRNRGLGSCVFNAVSLTFRDCNVEVCSNESPDTISLRGNTAKGMESKIATMLSQGAETDECSQHPVRPCSVTRLGSPGFYLDCKKWSQKLLWRQDLISLISSLFSPRTAWIHLVLCVCGVFFVCLFCLTVWKRWLKKERVFLYPVQ